MINFFRRIRKALLADNKFSKYLMYAIGEIALVMIGILLALQVNNWNEERKQKKQEQSYLIALNQEFKNNLEELDRVIILNTKMRKNAVTLAKYTGPSIPSISDKEVSKLIFGFINNEVQYRPGSGVINEIISSGKLDIFQNQMLKNALASMDGRLLNVRYQEDEELGTVRSNLTSIMQNGNVSSRSMIYDAYGENFDVDRGRFSESNLHLLKSITFDNHLTQFIYTSGYLESRYENLRTEIEKILSIIENQLKS